MALSERLKQPTAKEAEYRPKTEFDGQSGFIQTGPLAEAPKNHADILELFGYSPDEVRIVGNPRVSRWQVYGGDWLSAYRFHLEPVHDSRVDDLYALIRKHRAHKPVGAGSSVFNFQAGDLQLGKADEGGSDRIVDTYLRSVDGAKAELKRLRKHRNVGTVNLMFPGDCLEGNQSQGGRNMWRTDLTITEQIRVFRRLLMHTVSEFAPLTDELLVRVVNGNHDEVQRFQQTRPDDGHATEAAIAVSDAIALNGGAYGHVTVEVPPLDQGYMTVAAGDTVFTITHGHQWRRNGAMQWWSGHAFNGGNPGAAHVLAHGHWHAWEVETTANRTRVCGATFEGASKWFQENTGGTAAKGGLVYTTSAGAVSDLTLV
jgi:predicted phosphodiesterase